MLNKLRILIASPASAASNNGNWQTAQRWAHFLEPQYHVEIARDWDHASNPPDLLIALHARRSANAVAACAAAGRPCILVLTGTDLYRDIRHDDDARRSLQLVQHLVLLQEAGLAELPVQLHARTRVIYQSAPALPPLSPDDDRISVVMIGHLRAEKDPATFMRAARLASAPGLRFTQVGGALEEGLAQQARLTETDCTAYRWLGNLPHADTRELLRRSQLLVVPSLMEGGANVIIEAVTSGVPVLASDIAGNRGMLGAGYGGYFPVGDAAALARLIGRFATDAGFAEQLRTECAHRAPLFAPAHEQAALLRLVDNALTSHRTSS